MSRCRFISAAERSMHPSWVGCLLALLAFNHACGAGDAPWPSDGAGGTHIEPVLLKIEPRSARATGQITLRLSGLGLASVTRAQLGARLGTVASRSDEEVVATFELDGLAPGPTPIELRDAMGRSTAMKDGFWLRVDELRFQEPTVYPFAQSAESARRAAVGDINGDGIPDFVTLRPYAPPCVVASISVGRGQYSEVPLQLESSSAGCSGLLSLISIGDVNGDGVADLVVAEPAIGLRIYPGERVGADGPSWHFGIPRTIDTRDLSYRAGAIVDLNLDGRPDLAVIAKDLDNEKQTLLLFQQNNMLDYKIINCDLLTFGDSHTLPTDWNGDGHSDLGVITSVPELAFHAIFASSRSDIGCPTYTKTIHSEPAVGNIDSAAAGLINNDAMNDLLIAGRHGLLLVPGEPSGVQGSTISLIPQEGDGIQSLAIVPNMVAGNSAILAGINYMFALFELDLSGRISSRRTFLSSSIARRLTSAPIAMTQDFDILALTDVGLMVAQAPFEQSLAEVLPQAGGTPAVSGDVDGDGNTDLIFIDCAVSKEIRVVLGAKPEPDFSQSKVTYLHKLGLPTDWATPWCPRAQSADFDGDGRADLAFFVYSSQRDLTQAMLLLLRATETEERTFTIILKQEVNRPFYSFNSGVAIGDFDSNGKPDIAYLTNQVMGSGEEGEEIDGVQVLYSAADAKHPSAFRERFFRTLAQPVGLESGDFNGDGRSDLVIANQGDQRPFELLLGKVDGGMSEFDKVGVYSSSLLSGPPYGVLSADFNRDRQDDVVLFGQGWVTLFVNNGKQGFSPACSKQWSGIGHPGVCVSDLNLDGIPDIACTGEHFFSLLLTDGSGHCLPRVWHPGWPGGATILTVDINHDRLPDLLLGGGTLLRNYSWSPGGLGR